MKTILIILLMPVMVCCEGQKKARIYSSVSTQNASTMNDTAAISVNDTLPLIVQFYSIGEGINAQSKAKLGSYIAEKEKQLNKSITYQAVHWGREGEFDACFRLANLNATQRQNFIADLKKMFDDKSLVHILENENCRYVR